MRSRLCPLFLLAGLGLLFFADLVAHPRQVLYSDYSDILAEHLPAKHFLVQSWRQTGEVPLWCPYSYGGMPFVHDPQVAAFYPPHAVLFALPLDRIGAGMSWLIVAHLIMAGCFMYLYAGSNGLGTAGALVAGFGYMFAGKWLLHLLVAGHYITIGLAWLPLVLLGLERALRRKSLFAATWAGVAFAFLVLGTHPQWTLYAGFFIALWTLAVALEQAGVLSVGPAAGGQDEKGTAELAGTRRRRVVVSLLRWAGFGVWTALVGAALSAVQLLPTMELGRQSSRAGGVDVSHIFAAAGYSVLNLFGPPLAFGPSQGNLLWEERGALDILWVAVAAMAPVLCGGRVRFHTAVGLFVILYALGVSAALQWMPGFSLFRQPSRMFIVVGFPVAFLAGAATDALGRLRTMPAGAARTDTTDPPIKVDRRCRQVLFMALVLAFILLGSALLRLRGDNQVLTFEPYWAVLAVAVPVLWWLAGRPGTRLARGLCAVLLCASLWAFDWPVLPGSAALNVGPGLVSIRPQSSVYAPSACVRYVEGAEREHGRVLDRDQPESGRPVATSTPLGTGAPLAMILQIESVRGYTPLDVLRYKEYLQFIAGSDKPLTSLGNPFTFPVIGNFPVRNKGLLDLLGVRYLLQPGEVPLREEGWRPVEEDPRPRAYDFIIGGMRNLKPYVVYENPGVYPRAFVVPEARALPEHSRVLSTLLRTDFRRRVLLEPFEPDGRQRNRPSSGGFRKAAIREYLPNRVVVEASGDSPGYLVLADQWFPGWECTLDGRRAQLLRANFLFRGVAVPAGDHEVVFAFSPASYHVGRGISVAVALAVVGMSVVVGAVRSWRRFRAN